MLYVTLSPSKAVAGPVLITERSADVATVAVLLAVLLAPLESEVVVETLAVLLRDEPFASLELAFTTIWKAALAPGARVAMLPVTVPVPPTDGVMTVNVGPLFC